MFFLVPSCDALVTSSFLLLVVMPGATSSFLLLVATKKVFLTFSWGNPTHSGSRQEALSNSGWGWELLGGPLFDAITVKCFRIWQSAEPAHKCNDIGSFGLEKGRQERSPAIGQLFHVVAYPFGDHNCLSFEPPSHPVLCFWAELVTHPTSKEPKSTWIWGPKIKLQLSEQSPWH